MADVNRYIYVAKKSGKIQLPSVMTPEPSHNLKEVPLLSTDDNFLLKGAKVEIINSDGRSTPNEHASRQDKSSQKRKMSKEL